MNAETNGGSSPQTMNIYQRILAVMADLEYVRKESTKVNNQYTFVSHDAVSKKLHPLLVKHGIAVLPKLKEWTQNGNRTEVLVDVEFVNVDMPEERFTVPSLGFGIDQQDKGPGKAVSYACKYAMLKTFVLETGDDPERDNIDHEPEPEYSPEQFKEFHNIVESGDAMAYVGFMASLHPNVQTGLYNSFPQGKKVEGKKKCDMLESTGIDLVTQYVDKLREASAQTDYDGIRENVAELEGPVKEMVWKQLDSETRQIIREAVKEAA